LFYSINEFFLFWPYYSSYYPRTII